MRTNDLMLLMVQKLMRKNCTSYDKKLQLTSFRFEIDFAINTPFAERHHNKCGRKHNAGYYTYTSLTDNFINVLGKSLVPILNRHFNRKCSGEHQRTMVGLPSMPSV